MDNNQFLFLWSACYRGLSYIKWIFIYKSFQIFLNCFWRDTESLSGYLHDRPSSFWKEKVINSFFYRRVYLPSMLFSFSSCFYRVYSEVLYEKCISHFKSSYNIILWYSTKNKRIRILLRKWQAWIDNNAVCYYSTRLMEERFCLYAVCMFEPYCCIDILENDRINNVKEEIIAKSTKKWRT